MLEKVNSVLAIDDFDKTEGNQRRSGERVIKMTPKQPVPGLEDLEISVFVTRWKRGECDIWGWEWTSRGRSFHTSLGKDDGPPIQEHFDLQSAAVAAVKNARYWSDEERIPREERERQERKKKQEMRDRQIDSFLGS